MRQIAIMLLLLGGPALLGQSILSVPLKKSRQAREYRLMLVKVRGTVMTVNWKEVALADALKRLGRELGLNIIVSKTIKDRIDEEVVELQLTNVRASSVFKILAAQHKVVFQNRDGIVWVTTKEDAFKRSLVLKLYSVRGLLYSPPDFPAPRIGIRPSGVNAGEDEEEETEREQKDPEVLLDLIRQATGTDIWDLEGVSLQISKGTLIVKHSPEIQRKVYRFINRLRGVF